MSIILDALRKSENARQRQTGPGFAAIRTGQSKNGQPWWVTALLGLLILNVVMLGVVFLWPDAVQPPPRANTPSAPAETATTSQTAPLTVSQDDSANSVSQVASAVTEERAEGRLRAAARPRVQTLDSVTGTTEREPVMQAPAPTMTVAKPLPTTSSQLGLPSFIELRTTGSFMLPDLHLDIHVFSDQPGERFVFINMRKYREGERLEDGPTINEIMEDGVVMSHLGQQFILYRE